MFRVDFQRLARKRLIESRILLAHDEFSGAYYLAGLGVECAIKACICKLTKLHQFPDKRHTLDCYDHDPTALVKTARLHLDLIAECKSAPLFNANWNIVKDWKVDSRYAHAITRIEARALYSAVTSRKYGVLQWLRRHW